MLLASCGKSSDELLNLNEAEVSTNPSISIAAPHSPTGSWSYANQTSDGIVLSVELVRSSGIIRQYWQRIEYPSGLITLVFTTADCDEGTYFVSWMEEYNRGAKTASGVPEQAGVKQNSIPGSIGGSAFEAMCKDWRN